ncbi:hypothetical protein ACEPAH_8604 [Sanghuangporus vaninii]
MATLFESQSMEERRLQAGPLPRKRGEIGYRESMDRGNGEVRRDDNSTPLPSRHPADRDPEVPQTATDESGPSNPSAPNAVSPAPDSAPVTSTNADTSSMRKPSKGNSFLLWLSLRMGKKIGGVTLSTISRLTFQIFFLLGTIALWVVVSKVLAVSPNNDTPASATGSAESPPKSDPVFGSSTMIFLHVSFGIVTLVQLLFLERCIFIVRAQRYAHVHHGASLPMHSRNHEGNAPAGGVTSLTMSLAPWNRPPLPTYAAALAQSGVGTGDVEDNLIAIPPPPAYGNTRGSTLLLAGFMPNNMRGSVVRASRISRPISQASRLSRPVSYRSHDEEWEQRCDAERALYLAETLDRLENPACTTTNTAQTGR